jgi:uncharacterized membrane protein
MDAYADIWSDATWWIVFVVIAIVGLAGALGLLDRLQRPLER